MKQVFSSKRPDRARAHYVNGKNVNRSLYEAIFNKVAVIDCEKLPTLKGWSIEYTVVLN